MDKRFRGVVPSKSLFKYNKIKKRNKSNSKHSIKGKKTQVRAPTFKTSPVVVFPTENDQDHESTLESSEEENLIFNTSIQSEACSSRFWNTDKYYKPSFDESDKPSMSSGKVEDDKQTLLYRSLKKFRMPLANEMKSPRDNRDSSIDSSSYEEIDSSFSDDDSNYKEERKFGTSENDLQAEINDTSESSDDMDEEQRDEPSAMLSDPSDNNERNAYLEKLESSSTKALSVIENNYFIFKDQNHSILVMEKNAEVAFVGRAMLKVLCGEAKVLGYNLSPKIKTFVPAYSLKLQAHLTVKASASESVPKSNDEMKRFLSSKLPKYFISRNNTKNILKIVGRFSTVVLFKPIVPKSNVNYAFHMSSRNLTHVKMEKSLILDDHTSYKRVVTQNYAITTLTDVPCVDTSELDSILNDVISNITYSNTHGTPPPRIVVCGPKNSGKSTIIRYLMNAVLGRNSKLMHLEGDPGQGEFTPAGAVALSIVEEPLIGPPFTHQKTPEAMVYVGGKTVMNTPDTYSVGVMDLMLHYNKVFAHQPLFVNTMGWTRGMGQNLLMDVIRYVEPTFVIQTSLNENNVEDNLPNLTPSYVAEAPGWKTVAQEVGLGYELRIFSSRSQEETFFKSRLANSATPKIFRELATFAYWGRLQRNVLLTNFEPLNTFKPFQVPFKSVGIHFCNHTVPYAHLLEAINVCPVALCHVEKSQTERDPNYPSFPKRVNSIEGNVLIGHGIIRGINKREETILVITPEPISRLQGVNALVVIIDDIPVKLLASQNVRSKIPYMATSVSYETSLNRPVAVRKRTTLVDAENWRAVSI